MKKRLKKPTRLLLTLGTIAVPAALAVSCTNTNYGDSWKLDSHRSINTLEANDDGINSTYGFPTKIKSLVYSYASDVSYLVNSQKLGLFSKIKNGYDQFEKKVITNSDGKKETVIATTPNRDSFLKFELAKSVTLKYANGTSEIFNSDSIDSKELTSPTSKSINSKHFLDKIKSTSGLSSIEFGLINKVSNGETNWTQEITGKKMGKLVPEDFWTSIQSQIYFSSAVSREKEMNEVITNNSKETIANINQYVNKAAKWSVFHKSTSSEAPAVWVSNRGHQNYGIEDKKFLNTDQNKLDFLGVNNASQKSNKIVIPFDSKVDGAKKLLFWNIQIAKNNLFALSTNNKNSLLKKYPLPRSLFYNQKNYEDFINSKIYKTGIFSRYLVEKEEDYVTGGKYYLLKNDKKIRELSANKNYIHYDYFFNGIKNDQTNKKTTVLNISTNFIQNSPLVNTMTLQGYKEGFSFGASTEALSSKEYNDMLSNPEKWGMKFSTGYTSDKIFGDYDIVQILPGTPNADEWNEKTNNVEKGKNYVNVYFNDWYSKVMWGHSLKDLIKQKASGSKLLASDWADNYYGGTGIQFITNLLAALNSYTAVHNFRDSSQEWNSLLAPENPIVNYETVKPNPSTIFQAHPGALKDQDPRKNDLINTNSRVGLSIFNDGNGSKKNSFDQVKVDRNEYVEVNKNPLIQASRKYGPPIDKIKKIKENIKLAFDNAGVPSDKKVTFEWPIGRGNSSIQFNIIYKKAIAWLNTLDPRLNIVAMSKPHMEDAEMLDANVDVQEYSRDFQGLTKVMGGALGAWYNRLFAAKHGYGAMGLGQAGKYSINSPAGGIFNNVGYLQSGKFLGLSYYSSHLNLLKNNTLAGLQILIDSEKKVFDRTIRDLNPNDFVSSEVKTLVNGLLSNPPKFGELYKNTPGDISSYDYFGMHGFEGFRDLMRSEKYLNKHYKDYKNIKRDFSLISSKISGALSYEAMNEMELNVQNNTYKQTDVLKAISAFNILSPSSLNPLIDQLGNRTNPGISLQKNWFFTGSDRNIFYSYEWFRVDLKENSKGEIIGGGIN